MDVDEALQVADLDGGHGPMLIVQAAPVLAAEVRRLRARRTVLARQSPVVRRLRRWANGEHAGTDVAADVRALLESYDALLAMRDAPPATPGGA